MKTCRLRAENGVVKSYDHLKILLKILLKFFFDFLLYFLFALIVLISDMGSRQYELQLKKV